MRLDHEYLVDIQYLMEQSMSNLRLESSKIIKKWEYYDFQCKVVPSTPYMYVAVLGSIHCCLFLLVLLFRSATRSRVW